MNVRNKLLILLLSLISYMGAAAEVTIEECVDKAMANYPLVRKYGLMAATRDVDLSDINRSWLPRLGVYGQVTAQNVVPSFPEMLADVMTMMGQEIRGLGKIQYKAGVDVSQTIWDGGASKARREMTRSQDELQQASLDVELYSVRERVENLFFAILLTEEQISQSRVTYNLLGENLEKLRSMLRNGTAMQADLDMVEAQSLLLNQTILQAQSAVDGYREVLALFIGESLEGVSLAMPSSGMPSGIEPNRPELRMFDRQLDVNQASRRLSDSSLMPKIGLFAQAYYGYPGFDYFRSMINRELSFNIMAGIKVSWNIDSFYTRGNISRKTALKTDEIEVARDIFLFNTRMKSASQMAAIEGLRKVMADDSRIVALRANVRKAAESQLDNGVIDTTALLSKISDENMARLTARFHEIQLLQEIYKLKYTLDR